MGDLLLVYGAWFACADVGFEPVGEPPVIIHAAEPGTTPL